VKFKLKLSQRMTLVNFVVWLSFVLLSNSVSLAQTSVKLPDRPLTLDQAVDFALANYPAVSIDGADVGFEGRRKPVAFAVQQHNDRVLSAEITETSSELQDVGEKITGIRDADLKEMNDYVRACSEIAPLLDDYDRHLVSITDLYN
jgi:hypothetical protein